jgi:hypothetical protein
MFFWRSLFKKVFRKCEKKNSDSAHDQWSCRLWVHFCGLNWKFVKSKRFNCKLILKWCKQNASTINKNRNCVVAAWFCVFLCCADLSGLAGGHWIAIRIVFYFKRKCSTLSLKLLLHQITFANEGINSIGAAIVSSFNLFYGILMARGTRLSSCLLCLAYAQSVAVSFAALNKPMSPLVCLFVWGTGR